MNIRVFTDDRGIIKVEIVQCLGVNSSVVVGALDLKELEDLAMDVRVALMEYDYMMSEGSEQAINGLPF